MPKEREGFKYKKIYPNRFKTWIGIPALLHSSRQKPDVFFSPTHYLPRFIPGPVKKVMMIFDLAFLDFEYTFTKRDFLQLKNWTGYSVKTADHIITISQASKKDITSFYGMESKKITVAYCGFDKERFQPTYGFIETKEILQRYQILGKYVVFLGTIQPRKNLKRLIEAFVSIDNCKLVVIGKTSGPGRQGWKYQEILDLPKKLAIEEKVIFTGFVPSQDLPVIFSAADAYILPSLWEGFGIPVLEAMACGTPAIVSNVSSLPEVVGDAGLLVDPNSTTQIEQAIRTITTDKGIHDLLSKKSLQQVKKFSWEKMAKDVIKVLENV
jgi:glycosyltransferase involved in cell wall biosynthesis